MLAATHEHELDRGTMSVGPGMERTCALTRRVTPVGEMIRFVIGPEGEVVPDVKRKLPGRGLWITATRTAVAEAVKRNIFGRGFKRDLRPASDLAADTERALERAALDALAIAGKAGRVVTGAAKVQAALGRHDLAALVHAADAAANGRRKLDAALRPNTGALSREIAIIDLFTGGQLDLALGCPNVVHAALLAGPGVDGFLARVRRLQRFRTEN